ncbi:SRPBCC domain-containing protein [Candidatus Eisenbacteria bacterium]|uniref:SRPBCC domain-containing protein n=1 Tax=Eiseniibacteriota bacterium TaxID=2212470 RepID=A0ABV6YJM9_UNCEI
MTTGKGLPPIKCRTYINAPRIRVYEMLTTGDGWDKWFTQGTEVIPKPGGRIMFRWVNWAVDHYTCESGGPVLEAIPPSRFVFQWGSGDSTTTITFALETRGPGTVLNITESGYSASQRDLEAFSECSAGWGEAMTLLKVYLEHGVTYGLVPPTAASKTD